VVASRRVSGLQGFRLPNSLDQQGFCVSPSGSVCYFRGWGAGIYSSSGGDLMGLKWGPKLQIFASFARRRNCSPSEQAILGFFLDLMLRWASVMMKCSLGEGIARLASKLVWATFGLGLLWAGLLFIWCQCLAEQVGGSWGMLCNINGQILGYDSCPCSIFLNRES
jgi:hypothetical protein